MNYAIIINLDYEHHAPGVCRRVWDEISKRMVAAGFVPHFRLFLADLPRETVRERARGVVDATEAALAPEGIVVFGVVREFYWFEYEQINDLLAPVNELSESSVVYLDDPRLPLAPEGGPTIDLGGALRA